MLTSVIDFRQISFPMQNGVEHWFEPIRRFLDAEEGSLPVPYGQISLSRLVVSLLKVNALSLGLPQ
jgi:hypothetical protein